MPAPRTVVVVSGTFTTELDAETVLVVSIGIALMNFSAFFNYFGTIINADIKNNKMWSVLLCSKKQSKTFI